MSFPETPSQAHRPQISTEGVSSSRDTEDPVTKMFVAISSTKIVDTTTAKLKIVRQVFDDNNATTSRELVQASSPNHIHKSRWRIPNDIMSARKPRHYCPRGTGMLSTSVSIIVMKLLCYGVEYDMTVTGTRMVVGREESDTSTYTIPFPL